MAIAFTQEQEKVINLRDCNILVSAAAGSGKTAVLVERIVRMVCDESRPVDIDKLLIVTFTNAAAAEMRERIDIGIAEKLQENPTSEHIQKQATLLHNAQITTIHSFCLYILRNHFHEIGLDPAFRVADDNEVNLMKQDVLTDLLEEKFAQKDQEFLDCVAFFCPEGKIKDLETLVRELSKKASSCAFPEDWLEERKCDYRMDSEHKILPDTMEQYAVKYLKAVLNGLIQVLDRVIKIGELPSGPYMYGETIEQDKEEIERVLRETTFEGIGNRLRGISFGKLAPCRDNTVDAELKELAQKLRKTVKDRIGILEKKYFAFSEEMLLRHAEICDGALCTLLDLTLEYDARVLAKKTEKKVIDFSDMEHYTLQILLDREDGVTKPSKVAEEYKSYFQEILVDEYQDSNMTQEVILEAISGADLGHFNRFMVGDIKQSIYGFRQARPDLFLHKYETYQPDGRNCCRIDLSKNYRSRKEVVDSVNGIFERIMSKEIGGLEYDANAKLYAQADYVESCGNESELLLVEAPGKDEELSNKQAEALAVAKRIKELKQSFQVMDKATKTLRPVRYSDMVILTRSMSGWAEEFKSVMEQEGIPLYVTSKTGYFAASEVQELLQMLRVLDNPRQDIPLYGVLQSVMGGFSKQEIAQIRADYREGSLYEALCACENEKVSTFLEKLNRYRGYTVYMPIRELLERIVEDHDYLNYVTALPAGSKRRANVEMLYVKASDFEKSSYFGLFHFVRYMEQLEKYEVDYGEADFMDENADVVRMMTIHKSKGLEFPVTFVSGLGKQFNKKDFEKFMIADADLGIGIRYVNAQSRVKGETLRRNVLAQKMREDMLAEELRILYVAFTRAKEKLILTATMKDAGKRLEEAIDNAVDHLEYYSYINAVTYMDFLLPILAKTDLKVQLVDQLLLEEEDVKEQLYLDRCQTLLEQLDALDEKGTEADEVRSLVEQVSFRYPYGNLEKLYTKTSVSELKAEAMAEKDEAAHEEFENRAKAVYIPSFGREQDEVSGVLRGSAFHRGMELLDFEKIYAPIFEKFPDNYETYAARVEQSAGELRTILEQFFAEEAESLRLQKEYYSLISIPKVITFLKQECAYRMWRADRLGQLYKEQPFVLGIEATQLQKRFEGNAPEGESVLIQGIIDVFWIEEDKVILLDYKTDRVPEAEELWKRYETQVDYYTQALHRIVGKEVTEKILYSTCLETVCVR